MELTQQDFDGFKEEIKKEVGNQVDCVVEKILNYKLEVQNGEKKEMTLVEAIKKNYTNNEMIRSRLETGQINVVIEDQFGRIPRPLNDIIQVLVDKPGSWFSRVSKKSKELMYVLSVLGLLVGILWAVFTFIFSNSGGIK